MDKKPQNRPLENSDLAKLPRSTISKSMRNAEDIMADYIADPEKVSPEEERLVDRIVFEKTGRHVRKFNSKGSKQKFNGLVISKDGQGQLDQKPVDVKIPKEPETSSKVVTRGSVS